MRDIQLQAASFSGALWRAAVLLGLCLLSASDVAAQAKPGALKDFRIDGLVRFHNSVEAEATPRKPERDMNELKDVSTNRSNGLDLLVARNLEPAIVLKMQRHPYSEAPICS